MTVPAEKPKRKTPWWAWLIIIGTTVGVMAACAGCLSSAGNQPTDPTIGATVACEGFVQDQLKSPSSAQFSNESVHGPVAGKPNRYIVVGSVDAQNSFGAQLRNNFGCTTEKGSDGQWTLVDMTGLA